jgi:hypothetical protein
MEVVFVVSLGGKRDAPGFPYFSTGEASVVTAARLDI